MSKTTNTGVRTKGNRGGETSKRVTRQRSEVAQREAARVARWRGLVAKTVAECDKNGNYIPTAWLEEVEGRPMVDVITDFLCKTRGIGAAHPPYPVRYYKERDEYYETAKTRTRNAHERETVFITVLHHLDRGVTLANGDLHKMIKRFYRPGDCGIDTAISRAIVFAVGKAR